jgi:hypothetical protein
MTKMIQATDAQNRDLSLDELERVSGGCAFLLGVAAGVLGNLAYAELKDAGAFTSINPMAWARGQIPG